MQIDYYLLTTFGGPNMHVLYNKSYKQLWCVAIK